MFFFIKIFLKVMKKGEQERYLLRGIGARGGKGGTPIMFVCPHFFWKKLDV
jgi:hypothetical protein